MSVPKFPPRPSSEGALIVSSLPEQLPPTLRTTPVAEPPRRRRPPWPALGGLLALAVLGVTLVLWPSSPDEQPPSEAAPPAAEFAFTRAPDTPEAVLDSDCSTHAYGQTRDFLTTTPCAQLARALFTTSTADGRAVYTSVAVVRMRSADDATQLAALVRADGTGSVNDVLRDQIATVPGLDRLSQGGFASTVLDRHVIIAESDSPDPRTDAMAHRSEMKRASLAALELGVGLQ